MSVTGNLFDLVVIAGTDADRGARAPVGQRPIVIGRGSGAEMSLTDPRVSREHAQAVAAETGVAFAVLPDAKRPIVYRGAKVERAIVALGDELQIGDTVLRVEESQASERRLDARTLMTGEAEDVRAAAALYALGDAMRECLDVDAVARAIATWSKMAPVRALDARLEAVSSARTPNAEDAKDVCVRSAGTGESVVRIALQTKPPLEFALRYALEPRRVALSLQRLLIVAGTILSARISALQLLDGVKQDRDFVRVAAFGGATTFIGQSPAAMRLQERIDRLARADVTVLLTGETGTGKSFVARLLHERGRRADAPFRAVNCAAIPESLLEAELFGAEKGAFTGAVGARPGLFEVAGEGTLFLDEIGELSNSGQAKLLRVLEERRFERIGSTKTLSFRAQVVAATNQDVPAMVRAKTFREDLFFRICAHAIEIAPLRERKSDIEILARRFLSDLAPARGRRVRDFSREAIASLERHAWPGNVRELRNVVDSAIVNTDSDTVEAHALPEHFLRGTGDPPFDGPKVILPVNHVWLDEKNFEAAIDKSRGNVTKAAALLGMNRVSLHKRLRRIQSKE
jgi:transcriptional regulator with PAS, ATPase and Fis domain